jgi:hypothetical protein
LRETVLCERFRHPAVIQASFFREKWPFFGSSDPAVRRRLRIRHLDVIVLPYLRCKIGFVAKSSARWAPVLVLALSAPNALASWEAAPESRWHLYTTYANFVDQQSELLVPGHDAQSLIVA